jgi:transketolase
MKMSKTDEDRICELKQAALQIRKDVLDMSVEYEDGHVAPSFSEVEILVALYDEVIGESDRFILSKGHGCMAFYAVLRRKGHDPRISGHPDKEECEGICCTTGSLGHGLPIGVGMAFARKHQNRSGHIYVLMGDGECQEGTTWESLYLASRFKLDNLTVIVDNNQLQALSSIKEIIGETNLREKFSVFGCNAIDISGHDFNELLSALSQKTVKKDHPTAIIARTIKGKGVSFMENDPCWHSRVPDKKLLQDARSELG